MTGVHEADEPTDRIQAAFNRGVKGTTGAVCGWTCPHVTFTGPFVVPPTWSCGCQLRPIRAAH